MIYYKPAFKLFVKELMLRLRDNEFLDMPQIRERRPTRKIWILHGKDEIFARSLKIAGEYSDNPMIFDDILHRGLKYHTSAHQIIIAGLKYLGKELPEDLLIQKLSVEQEAGVLFQQFLENYGDLGKTILLNNPELKVYDWKAGQFLKRIEGQEIQPPKNISITQPENVRNEKILYYEVESGNQNVLLQSKTFENDIRNLVENIFFNAKNNNIQELKELFFVPMPHGSAYGQLLQSEEAKNLQVFNIKPVERYENDGLISVRACADVCWVNLEQYYTSEEIEEFKDCSIRQSSIAYRTLFNLVAGGEKITTFYDPEKIKFDDLVSAKDVTNATSEHKKAMSRFLPILKHRAVANLFRYYFVKVGNRWLVQRMDDILDISNQLIS